MNTFIILITTIFKVVSAESNNTKLNDIENERNDIYKNITEAFNATIILLEQNNDTESLLGVEYIKSLREKLQSIHYLNITDIDLDEDIPDLSEFDSSNNTNSLRRAFGMTRNEIRAKLMELIALKRFKKKGVSKVVEDEHKLKMQIKLNEWLEKRMAEKRKARELRNRLKILGLKWEQCPREGTKKKKKGSKGVKIKRRSGHNVQVDENQDDQDFEKKDKKKKRKISTYPCCRKCCKRSVLGCL